MPEGVIYGGWTYVIAAYGITVVALTTYGVHLFRRLRSETGEVRDDG